MAPEQSTPPRRIVHALQNGTGAVLSKLAVISIPFLLTTIGFLLNSTFQARDLVMQQSLQGLSGKVEELSSRVESLGSIVRETSDRAAATAGDIRALQTEQRGLERRLDERPQR